MRVTVAGAPIVAIVLATAAHAAPPDPIRSPECMAARAELDQTADDAARKVAGAKERLVKARKEVLEACLGHETGERARAGAPNPAITVAPPVMQVPRETRAPVMAPPPSVAYTPPAVVTTCDSAGCWDSSGHRLNNLGPMIVGPRGPCTVVGGIAHCP